MGTKLLVRITSIPTPPPHLSNPGYNLIMKTGELGRGIHRSKLWGGGALQRN